MMSFLFLTKSLFLTKLQLSFNLFYLFLQSYCLQSNSMMLRPIFDLFPVNLMTVVETKNASLILKVIDLFEAIMMYINERDV